MLEMSVMKFLRVKDVSFGIKWNFILAATSDSFMTAVVTGKGTQRST